MERDKKDLECMIEGFNYSGKHIASTSDPENVGLLVALFQPCYLRVEDREIQKVFYYEVMNR